MILLRGPRIDWRARVLCLWIQPDSIGPVHDHLLPEPFHSAAASSWFHNAQAAERPSGQPPCKLVIAEQKGWIGQGRDVGQVSFVPCAQADNVTHGLE